MGPEYELPLPTSRRFGRTGPLIAIGAFSAGLACVALFVAPPVRMLPADDKATTIAAVHIPPARSLPSDDQAPGGESVASLPVKTACEDQVWPRFSPECLNRNGEPTRPVRFVEPNRLAERSAETRPQAGRRDPATTVQGRETLGMATPMARRPQTQATSEAPAATPAGQQRRAERTRTSRNRSVVAGNREQPRGDQVEPFGLRRRAAPAHGQPFMYPPMANAPDRTRRTPSQSIQSYAYPHVQNY